MENTNSETSQCKDCKYNQNGWGCEKWINVDDRLPTESGEYLVINMDKDRTIMLVAYSTHYRLFNTRDFVPQDLAWKCSIPVTHWMPLPEPPKEIK